MQNLSFFRSIDFTDNSAIYRQLTKKNQLPFGIGKFFDHFFSYYQIKLTPVAAVDKLQLYYICSYANPYTGLLRKITKVALVILLCAFPLLCAARSEVTQNLLGTIYYSAAVIAILGIASKVFYRRKVQENCREISSEISTITKKWPERPSEKLREYHQHNQNTIFFSQPIDIFDQIIKRLGFKDMSSFSKTCVIANSWCYGLRGNFLTAYVSRIGRHTIIPIEISNPATPLELIGQVPAGNSTILSIMVGHRYFRFTQAKYFKFTIANKGIEIHKSYSHQPVQIAENSDTNQAELSAPNFLQHIVSLIVLKKIERSTTIKQEFILNFTINNEPFIAIYEYQSKEKSYKMIGVAKISREFKFEELANYYIWKKKVILVTFGTVWVGDLHPDADEPEKMDEIQDLGVDVPMNLDTMDREPVQDELVRSAPNCFFDDIKRLIWVVSRQYNNQKTKDYFVRQVDIWSAEKPTLEKISSSILYANPLFSSNGYLVCSQFNDKNRLFKYSPTTYNLNDK